MPRDIDAVTASAHASWTCRAAAVAALALVLPASAATYKWVDANGRTVYSDQPPPGNIKSEVVGAAPPAANPAAARELAGKEAEFKKRQLDKQEDARKSEKSRADMQQLAGFCAQARTQHRCCLAPAASGAAAIRAHYDALPIASASIA